MEGNKPEDKTPIKPEGTRATRANTSIKIETIGDTDFEEIKNGASQDDYL